uniref:Cyclin-like domain-containing protein n=1 Tax=Romanomermis culicivorax TaxID=13658 RepID=A0A915IZP3_ROMCU
MFNNSTHKNFWLFENKDQLDDLRRMARENFVEKLMPEDRSKCLTTEDERDLRQLVEETAQKFCESFEPPMPPSVAYLGFVYFKRIYLNYSIMEYLAKNVMMACLYLACKVDEFNVSIDDFVSNLKSGTREGNTEIILGMEVQIMRLLKFHLTVHGPYRALEGHFIEMKTKCPEIPKPDVFRKDAAEFLWKSMLTDVNFLYAPSQLALSSILYASKRLGYDIDSYIENVLCNNDAIQYEKLMTKLNDCNAILNQVTPISQERATEIQEKVRNCVLGLQQRQLKRRSDQNENVSYASSGKRTKYADDDSDLD